MINPARPSRAWLGWTLGLAAALAAGVLAWKHYSPAKPAMVAAPQMVPAVPRANAPLRESRPASVAAPTVPRVPSALEALASASRTELLAAARGMLDNGRLEDVVALLEYLAAKRPEFAIDLARDAGRNDGERHLLLYTVVGDWAQADPASAVRWAFEKARSYDVPGNASLLYIVLEQVASDDPKQLLAVASRVLQAGAGTVTPSDVARLTIEALAKTGQQAVARDAIEHWARGPEASRLDENVFEVATLALAQASFADATRWLQTLPRSPARNEAFGPIATVWSQQDPRAAMDWAQSLDPADGGDDVRVAAFGRWVKTDPGAAAQWLREHPSPTSDRMQALLNPPAPAS